MNLLTDEKGLHSIMRVMFALCIVSGIVYLFLYKDYIGSGMLLGYGFTGKLVQKKLEK